MEINVNGIPSKGQPLRKLSNAPNQVIYLQEDGFLSKQTAELIKFS